MYATECLVTFLFSVFFETLFVKSFLLLPTKKCDIRECLKKHREAAILCLNTLSCSHHCASRFFIADHKKYLYVDKKIILFEEFLYHD